MAGSPPAVPHLPHTIGSLRVAIVHDWLIGGGAERVVSELHHVFPDAPIYTSYATREWRDKLDGMVVTGILQKRPFSKLRKYIPFLRAMWFSHLRFKDYDLVISSSGAEAKGVRVKGKTIHINYCHAPTHYYWSRYNDYLSNPGFGPFNFLARIGLKVLVGPMRKWDYKAAQRPQYIIANSTYTEDEIKKYYERDSIVIHPPIDIARFANLPTAKPDQPSSRKGFVITGRQTPYKRIDLAVAACSKINVPLTVIGNGPEHEKLVEMAGPTVNFRTDVTDTELPALLAGARAFIFPGLDDFGIAPLEAMAAGTPVIAYKAGGAMDYIVAGETGAFFDQQNPDTLALAIAAFNPDMFSEELITQRASYFSPETFQKNIISFVSKIFGFPNS